MNQRTFPKPVSDTLDYSSAKALLPYTAPQVSIFKIAYDHTLLAGSPIEGNHEPSKDGGDLPVANALISRGSTLFPTKEEEE